METIPQDIANFFPTIDRLRNTDANDLSQILRKIISYFGQEDSVRSSIEDIITLLNSDPATVEMESFRLARKGYYNLFVICLGHDNGIAPSFPKVLEPQVITFLNRVHKLVSDIYVARFPQTRRLDRLRNLLRRNPKEQ